MGGLSSQRGRSPAVCWPTFLGRSWAPIFGMLVQPTGSLIACPQSVGWLPYADLEHMPLGGLYSQRGRSPVVSRELSVSGPSVPTFTVDGMSSQRGRSPAVCRPLSVGELLVPPYRRLVQPAGPLGRWLSADFPRLILGTYLWEACPASGAAIPQSVGWLP